MLNVEWYPNRGQNENILNNVILDLYSTSVKPFYTQAQYASSAVANCDLKATATLKWKLSWMQLDCLV